MKRTLFALTLLVFFIACSTPIKKESDTTSKPRTLEDAQIQDANAPDYYWVQYGEDNAVIVRAIYKRAKQDCSKIDAVKNDGSTESIDMKDRLGSTGQDMPRNFTDITVCEATLSTDIKSAKLGGEDIAIPDKTIERVVVIGDTGCRDKNRNSQECGPILKDSEKKTDKPEGSDGSSDESKESTSSSKSDWNFKETVKSAKGLDKTDFVIHVGDYVYRECLQEEECGKDQGRNWQTWETDFFDPAKPLLASTPWVFTRGNHEDCAREYRGWFLFFDPRPIKDNTFTQCNTHTDGFQVNLDGLNLIVLDSSDEGGLNEKDIALVNKVAAPTWLVTHVPLYGVSHYGNATPKTTAAKDAITGSNVKFLVSGHIHFFEMIQFPPTTKIPPQMISGGGATKLDHFVSQEDFAEAVSSIGGDKDRSELISKTFTFAYADFESGGWKITVEDQDGTIEDRTFTISK